MDVLFARPIVPANDGSDVTPDRLRDDDRRARRAQTLIPRYGIVPRRPVRAKCGSGIAPTGRLFIRLPMRALLPDPVVTETQPFGIALHSSHSQAGPGRPERRGAEREQRRSARGDRSAYDHVC
jgi:hypothetical protein